MRQYSVHADRTTLSLNPHKAPQSAHNHYSLDMVVTRLAQAETILW